VSGNWFLRSVVSAETFAGFGRFGGFGVEAEEEAKGEAIVVEAFGGGVEQEVNVLAVVAVEGGVVEVVTVFRSGEWGGG